MYNTLNKDKENKRLNALKEYQILDTPEDDNFNHIVKMAAYICKVPMSTISLIDEDRQWFKAKIGLEINETDRYVAFCHHTVAIDDLLVVEDASQDSRFKNNPFVIEDNGVRFYAGYPIRSKDGYPLGTVCVIDSVVRQISDEQIDALKILASQTEQLFNLRLANINLRKQNKLFIEQKTQLSQLDDFKNDIIRIIGHDVKTPLNSIMTFFELFENGLLENRDISKIITDIKLKIDYVDDLLRNLTEWASTLDVHHKIKKEKLKVHELIEAELNTFKKNAELKKNLLFNLVSKDITIHADKHVFSFILRNLLSNAMKFTENGHIKVSHFTKEGLDYFIVHDNGTGMSRETLKKINNQLQYHSKTGTHNERGLGIGLLLVRKFIKRHKGNIEIKSEEGQGSSFIFSI